MRIRKTRSYIPKIEDGIPIPKERRKLFDKRIAHQELEECAQSIKLGQSVLLPRGSVWKFIVLVRSRSLQAYYQPEHLKSGRAMVRVWIV